MDIFTTIITPIIVGSIASFIAWYIPSERFSPKGQIVRYNQFFVDVEGKDSKHPILKRNVQIANTSSVFAMYNISCFFEFIDAENNIVYHEEKQQAYAAAKTTEDNLVIIPFKMLPVSEIEKWKPVKVKLVLIYENRYGTKKVSDFWKISEYDIKRNTFTFNSK